MREKATDTLSAIFSGINGSKHILHLYTPSMNKYAIQVAFVSKTGNDRTAIITGEKPESILEQFGSLNSKLSILNIRRLDKVKEFARVVIDAGTISHSIPEERKTRQQLIPKKLTIHKRRKIGQIELIKSFINPLERENYLNGIKAAGQILCTYDLSTLNPDNLKDLVEAHDKLILTTDDTMILSSKSFSSKNLRLNEETIERFVKNELEAIVLALIAAKPMCGNDIKKKIFESFNILLSSGTIYPLLYKLQKQGLVKCEYGIKTKIYKSNDEKEIRNILNDALQVKNFLNAFILSSLQDKQEETMVVAQNV